MTKRHELTDCRKCGRTMGLFLLNVTELIGKYQTVLCPDCVNLFHLYVTEHPIFTALLDAEDALNILVSRTCGDGVDRTEELTAGARQVRALKRELYYVSEAWVADKEPA